MLLTLAKRIYTGNVLFFTCCDEVSRRSLPRLQYPTQFRTRLMLSQEPRKVRVVFTRKGKAQRGSAAATTWVRGAKYHMKTLRSAETAEEIVLMHARIACPHGYNSHKRYLSNRLRDVKRDATTHPPGDLRLERLPDHAVDDHVNEETMALVAIFGLDTSRRNCICRSFNT